MSTNTTESSESRTRRTRHIAAMAASLELVDSPSGTGETRRLPVWNDHGQSHGLWEMTPGELKGVLGPESVYIITGRARVVIHPSQEVVFLQAGDVFVLDSNETADWDITETVRKFYVINR